MNKHAFATAAALALVLAAGSAHAAGKVGEVDGPFGSGADRLGAFPIEQTSLDWAAGWTNGVHPGVRDMPRGEFVQTAKICRCRP